MLKQRVITAFALVAVFLAALFGLPDPLFAAFTATVVLIGAWEWSNLAGFRRRRGRFAYVLLMAIFVTFLAIYLNILTFTRDPFKPLITAISEDRYQQLLVIGAVFWALALLWVQGYPSSAILWGRRPLRALMGVLVLGPTWVALTYVRAQPNGAWLLLLIVAIVALADIGGYFVGRRFGRHKLAPNVSPGKTWEGVAGGVLANILLSLLLWMFLDVPLWVILVLVIPTSLVSVLGDLLESMIKRQRGIKDSSALLPGHGGVLDRVDSLTAAAPIFALALLSLPMSFG
ncbi:MAG TPA: phosphatidate cytidylyltransferase [Cellvibrionaceae bacterium]